MKKFLVILITLAISATVVIGLVGYKSVGEDFSKYEGMDLTENAKFSTSFGSGFSKETMEGIFLCEGDYIEVTFEKTLPVDTVWIKEKGTNILEFELFACDGEQSFKSIYRQDILEKRLCTFDVVKTDRIRIKINKLKEDTTASFSELKIYKDKKRNADFRVTSYLLCRTIESYSAYVENYGLGAFDVITDVILFGGTLFYDDGSISFESNFVPALENLRKIKAETGNDFNVIVNFLPPHIPYDGNDWEENQIVTGDYYARAMDPNDGNGEILVRNLASLVESEELDGVAFDWEFILNGRRGVGHWNSFADFLVELNAAMPEEKMISLAMVDWSCNLPARGREVVDMVELMSYDLFDDYGNHCNFPDGAVNALNTMLLKGFDADKIDLGLAFYARETQGNPTWVEYAAEADTLGVYGNYSDKPISLGNAIYSVPRWYNSATMIRDKTAYAISQNIGGVMLWNHGCDTHYDKTDNEGRPLSLFRAIATAVNERA